MKIRNLKSPPIVEALILVVPQLENEATSEQLLEIKDNLSKNYPHVTEKKVSALSFRVKDDESSFTQKEESKGFELSDSDKKVFIQLDPDKLIISRLAPYKDGDELVSLCNEIAGVYCNTLNSQKINHFALRYINKMNVWSSKIESSINIKTTLNCVSKDINAYKIASKFQIHDPDSDVASVVHYVVDVPENLKRDKDLGVLLDVILDIDVYRRNITISKDNKFDNEIKKLREFKNLIFFENVDESLLKEYDQ